MTDKIFEWTILEKLLNDRITCEILWCIRLKFALFQLHQTEKFQRYWIVWNVLQLISLEFRNAGYSVYCSQIHPCWESVVVGCNTLNFKHFRKPARLAVKRSQLPDFAEIFQSNASRSAEIFQIIAANAKHFPNSVPRWVYLQNTVKHYVMHIS